MLAIASLLLLQSTWQDGWLTISEPPMPTKTVVTKEFACNERSVSITWMQQDEPIPISGIRSLYIEGMPLEENYLTRLNAALQGRAVRDVILMQCDIFNDFYMTRFYFTLSSHDHKKMGGDRMTVKFTSRTLNEIVQHHPLPQKP